MMRAQLVLSAQEEALWHDCSSDVRRMYVNNVTLADKMNVGGVLNVSVEARVFQRIEADAPVYLSLTRGSAAPMTASFESGLCGEHQFQVENAVFFVFGVHCPAEPGVHHWTLLGVIPPWAPRGTYASRISVGDLCMETRGIAVGPFL